MIGIKEIGIGCNKLISERTLTPCVKGFETRDFLISFILRSEIR